MDERLESITVEMRCLADPLVGAIIGSVQRRLAPPSDSLSADASSNAGDTSLWELGCGTIQTWADHVDAALLKTFLQVGTTIGGKEFPRPDWSTAELQMKFRSATQEVDGNQTRETIGS